MELESRDVGEAGCRFNFSFDRQSTRYALETDLILLSVEILEHAEPKARANRNWNRQRALCVRAELPQTLVNFNVVKVEDESFDRISSRSNDGPRSNDRLKY